MATEGKEKAVDVVEGTSTHPPVEKSPSTELLTNPFVRDNSTSIYRHEYNDGMSAMKAQMNEVTLVLRALMSKVSDGDNPVITPTIPRVEGGDLTSQFRDDGRNGNPLIPLHGNGSGVNSAVAPPPKYHSLPLPEPHFAHAGPTPIINKDEYPIWAYHMKRHLKGSSEELWKIIQDGFHPYD